MLKKYSEEHNATVIISSHNLNHTIDVCPRIALLENGVIIRDIMNENNSAEKELEDYFNVRRIKLLIILRYTKRKIADGSELQTNLHTDRTDLYP